MYTQIPYVLLTWLKVNKIGDIEEMLEEIVNSLEAVGTTSINSLNIDATILDQLQEDKIKEISPKILLEVINYFDKKKEKMQIERSIERISLFFKTKYSNSSIFHNWQNDAKLPPTIRRHVLNSNLKEIAEKILKKSILLIEVEDRIQEISSKEKITKKDNESIRKNSERTEDLSDEIDELKESFIFALHDIESSLGGEF
jgi:hypothetical protein